jgi:hypothetical protein
MEKENLSLLMGRIIFLEIIPNIANELKELNLKEHIISSGTYYGEAMRGFKVKDNGELFVEKREEEGEYELFSGLKEKMKDLEEFSSSNSSKVIKSFMLKLTYDLSHLRLMKKEIQSSIRKVKGDLNSDVVFRNLMTEN